MDILNKLETELEKKKKIFLIDQAYIGLAKKIEVALIEKDIQNIQLWTYEKIEGKYVKTIPKEEFDEVVSLYKLYEFSDRIIYLSDDKINPSLENFVINELLDETLLVEALLYK